MLAVKQIVRPASGRLQSMVGSKFKPPNLRFPPGTSTSFLRQSSALTVPQVNFSSHSNWLASPSKAQKASILPTNEVSQLEPDVLYHMIEIEIRSSDPMVLQSYNKAITMAAQYLGLDIAHNEVGKKPHLKRWTVLKSKFVHKKHMVSYEVRTYHHNIKLERLTGSTADTFLEYIQRNLPEGVSMRVGRERMEKLPEHLLTPPSSGT